VAVQVLMMHVVNVSVAATMTWLSVVLVVYGLWIQKILFTRHETLASTAENSTVLCLLL